MKITVIGCGRWGSFIAWYLDSIGKQVTLYGRNESRNMQQFLKERRNNVIQLPETIHLSTNLKCVREADVIVISINAQGLQKMMEELKSLQLRDKIFVL